MKSHLVKLVVLACVVTLGACSKKRTRRAEVVECSSISLDAKGTTLCLVQLYKWKLPDAQRTAEARAHELDSLKTSQEDSVWGLSAAKHKRDFQACQRGSEQLNNCLLVAGWPLRRVRHTTDEASQRASSVHGQAGLQSFVLLDALLQMGLGSRARDGGLRYARPVGALGRPRAGSGS